MTKLDPTLRHISEPPITEAKGTLHVNTFSDFCIQSPLNPDTFIFLDSED